MYLRWNFYVCSFENFLKKREEMMGKFGRVQMNGKICMEMIEETEKEI